MANMTKKVALKYNTEELAIYLLNSIREAN